MSEPVTVDGAASGARRLSPLLRRPLVWWASVAVLLAAGAVWFGLPRVGVEGVTLRLAGVLALLGLVGALLGAVVLVRGRKRERQVPGDEALALAAAMDRPLSLLDRPTGTVFLGTAGRYRVPWYLLMGAGESGKSTLIRSSGLHFPYDDDEWLCARGEGGTGCWDWWLTDCALFLDTAGRYTTEPPEQTGWHDLLRLLRRARRRRPVDGVLVTLSADELSALDASGLRRRARVLRERLAELELRLGVRPPVLLIVTGLDRLSGYEAFLTAAGGGAWSGPWGVAAADAESDPGRAAERLQAQAEEARRAVMATSAGERDATGVFAFAAEMRAITGSLADLLRLLQRRDPYRRPPAVEAVYLTGNAPGQPSLSPGLFTEGVVPLAKRLRPTPSRRFRRRLVQAALFTCVLGGVALLAYGTAERYHDRLAQSAAVAEGAAAVAEAMAAGDRHPGAALEAVNRLQALEDKIRGESGAEREVVLALDPGRSSIAELQARLQTLLIDVAGEQLLPEALQVLQLELEGFVDEWPALEPSERAARRDAYREALAVWLRLSGEQVPIGDDRAAWLLARLVAAEQGLATPGVDGPLARGLKRALADRSQRVAARGRVDTAAERRLVEQAREQLRTPPRPEAIKRRLLAEAAIDLPPLTLEAMAPGGASAVWVAQRPVAGVFRGEAWGNRLQPALEEHLDALRRPDPVLARGEAEALRPAQARALAKAVEARYLRAFVDYWLEWFEALEWRSAEGVREQVVQLEKAVEGGALAALLEGVHGQLTAHADADPVATLGQQLGRSLGRYRHDPRGRELLTLVAPDDDGEVPPLAEVGVALGAAADQLEALASAADPGEEALKRAALALRGDEERCSLRAAEGAFRQAVQAASGPVQRALEPLLLGGIDAAWLQVRAEAAAELEERWQVEVLDVYRDRLAGRFPLEADGADAAPGDFEAFFAPERGTLWVFKTEEMAPFLRGADGQGGERRWRGAGLGIAAEVTKALDAAARIRDGLFDESGQAQLRYRVSPVANADLTDMRWESEGETLRYRNGPPVSVDLSWSPSSPEHGRIAAVSAHDGAMRDVEADGPWALFRLLSRADERERLRSNAVRARWALHDGREVSHQAVEFVLRTERSTPLLHWGDLTRFRLPARLIEREGA